MKIKFLPPARTLCPALFALAALALTSCGDKKESSDAKSGDAKSASSSSSGLKRFTHPGTESGIKAVADELAKPGADVAALTKMLRPVKADYEAAFAPDLAAKVMAMFDPMWDSGQAVAAPKPGQTEPHVFGASTTEINTWSGDAPKNLPGGYEKIKGQVKDGASFYVIKFWKPGETAGMSYDAFVFVNGHWCWFPKPWRAVAP